VTMIINILTLFPEYFSSSLSTSILKRAQEAQLVTYNKIDIRQFATDSYRTADDHPYGGGAGMVLKVEPIDLALQSLGENKGRVILTSAKGALFTQANAVRLAQCEAITIIAGHYEGVDERVAQHLADEELRIGDYVLTGGEPAAVVITDAIVRLLPGVLGNVESLLDESHGQPGYLSYPQYSRPEEYKGWKVPEVLLSGDHAAIEQWRKNNARMEHNEND
jgi:tRNA (guanine37-N1)-methyltransferase